MTLKEYISAVGDQTAAKLLGISARAARSYRTEQRYPRPATAARMVKSSAGKLTMTSIFNRTAK